MQSIIRKASMFLQQLCMDEYRLKPKIIIFMYNLLVYIAFKIFTTAAGKKIFSLKVGVAPMDCHWLAINYITNSIE